MGVGVGVRGRRVGVGVGVKVGVGVGVGVGVMVGVWSQASACEVGVGVGVGVAVGAGRAAFRRSRTSSASTKRRRPVRQRRAVTLDDPEPSLSAWDDLVQTRGPNPLMSTVMRFPSVRTWFLSLKESDSRRPSVTMRNSRPQIAPSRYHRLTSSSSTFS